MENVTLHPHVLAIPAERLGILESTFRGLPTWKTKRNRKQEFERIVRVMKDLHLLDKGSMPVAVSLGVDSSGQLLAIINFAVETRAEVRLPEEKA